jgi:alginate O-acetyltransferase complex protein AlgJ
MTRYAGGTVVATIFLLFSCSGGNTKAPDPNALLTEWSILAHTAEQQGTTVVEGRDGWLFFGPELRHLGVGEFWGDRASEVSRARRPEWADPIPAILDFHRQLASVGVELIIVPVPPKASIYPEKLSSVELSEPPPRLDIHHQEFYDVLRSHGVTLFDLTPTFLSHRRHARGPLYCRQDTHWSGTGTVLAAEQISAQVRSKRWFEAVPKESYQREWRNVEIAGDLWKALDEPRPVKEHLSLRLAGTEGTLTPVEPNRSSPVVVLGDSHTLVFHAGDDMHARGAGLADQLALELGFAVDLVGVRGSGATAARINLLRRAQATTDFWAAKRLVLWCFSAREFTESDGWRKVPIE